MGEGWRRGWVCVCLCVCVRDMRRRGFKIRADHPSLLSDLKRADRPAAHCCLSCVHLPSAALIKVTANTFYCTHSVCERDGGGGDLLLVSSSVKTGSSCILPSRNFLLTWCDFFFGLNFTDFMIMESKY